MKTFRFTARVSQEGTIQIPNNAKLIDKEVEIIMVPKSPQQKNKMGASKFIDKWAGFLTNSDTDKSKFDYLTDKYK